jgi:hypothetical protein
MPTTCRAQDLAASLRPFAGWTIARVETDRTFDASGDNRIPSLLQFLDWQLAAVAHAPLQTPAGKSDLAIVLRDKSGLEFCLAILAADIVAYTVENTVGDLGSFTCALCSGWQFTLGLENRLPDRWHGRLRFYDEVHPWETTLEVL